MKVLHLNLMDEAATETLGKTLAEKLFTGAFVAMFGGLGAGKTTLVKALAGALGIHDIMSPTFTIVREHTDGETALFHFDAYRLESEEELYAIGFEDYLARNGVIVMEWCENVSYALPAERLEIHISGSGCDAREAELVSTAPKYDAFIAAAERLFGGKI